MKNNYQWHTIAETFKLICSNESPWIAIGNFLNDWWFYATDYRARLIETPLSTTSDIKTQRWAAFCAAMIETLCTQCLIPCPEWTREFSLSQPWFYYKDTQSRAWLLAHTTTAFQQHNVYIGNNVLSGKWDRMKQPDTL